MILNNNIFITTVLLCLLCVYSTHASSIKTLTLEKGDQLTLPVYLDDTNISEEIEHIRIRITYDSEVLQPLGFRKDNGILSDYSLSELLQIQGIAVVNIYGNNVYTQFGPIVELVLKAKDTGIATIDLNEIICNDQNLSGGFWIADEFCHRIKIEVVEMNSFYISDIEDIIIYEDNPFVPVPFSLNIPNNGSAGNIPMRTESSKTDIIPHPIIRDKNTIMIHPKNNSFGKTNITVYAQYNMKWYSKTFSVEVLPVNDAPTFSIPAAITITETSGLQVFTNWATNISSGAPNEVDQELTFSVSVDNQDLFHLQPTIDPITGDLEFYPFDNENGQVQISVFLKDDGGTINGGINSSTRKNCTLTIVPFSPSISDNPVKELRFISTNQPISLDKVTPYIRIMACDDYGGAVIMESDTQIWLQTESPDSGWFYVLNDQWAWHKSNALVVIREGEYSALFKYRNGKPGAFQIMASEILDQSWTDAMMTVQVKSDATEVMGDIDGNGIIDLKDVIREMQVLSK
jgi:hypothetical protein